MIGDELTLGIILGAALLDSINPCVLGVLIFLLAFMTRVFKKPGQMLIGGLIYTLVVYITYLALGFGIFQVTVSIGIANAVYWLAALIAIGAGLIEIKDFFAYGKGFTLQLLPGSEERIKHYTKKIEEIQKKHPQTGTLLLVPLGIFVVLVELPCTGAPYFAILALLASGDYALAVPYLLLYNFVFVLPLLVIIGIAYFGMSSEKLEAWRKKKRGAMRLIIGLFLLALGGYMIYSITVF